MTTTKTMTTKTECNECGGIGFHYDVCSQELPTVGELRASNKRIKDGTAAHSIIRNGRGVETGRITVYYSAACDQFFSIPTE